MADLALQTPTQEPIRKLIVDAAVFGLKVKLRPLLNFQSDFLDN
jgi:hypothetical protein